MRRIKEYKAFCSYGYIWMMYVILPLCVAAFGAGIYYFKEHRGLEPGSIGTFLPIAVILYEAMTDSMLFAGFCGSKAYGVRLLVSSPKGRRMVLSACTVDIIRRFVYCAIITLAVPLATGSDFGMSFFWSESVNTFTNAAVVGANVIGLFAFSQLAVLVARHFMQMISNYVVGLICVLPFMTIKVFAPGFPVVTLIAAIIAAVLSVGLSIKSIDRKVGCYYE